MIVRGGIKKVPAIRVRHLHDCPQQLYFAAVGKSTRSRIQVAKELFSLSHVTRLNLNATYLFNLLYYCWVWRKRTSPFQSTRSTNFFLRISLWKPYTKKRDARIKNIWIFPLISGCN